MLKMVYNRNARIAKTNKPKKDMIQKHNGLKIGVDNLKGMVSLNLNTRLDCNNKMMFVRFANSQKC